VMRARRFVRAIGPAVVVTFLFVPSAVLAQDAEIAGVVTDNTGGILPGVTVEASSPALIEQSRVVFTDSQGAYRIIALNPGEYTVTFSLPGFSTVVVEGTTLAATFSANVDAQMSVGGIEETITVSGESPLVDVATVTQTQALSTDVIDDLPTGRSFQNLGILVPGVSVPLSQQDVGGADGANWQTMEVHGSRGDQMPLILNGMPFNNMNNTGGGYNHTQAINTGTVQEMTITTSGTDAEARSSGVIANTIAKEGGNQFTYYLYGDYTNGGMQSDNLSQALIDQGLGSVNAVKQVSEFNPAMGGPLVEDRLWFYAGYRSLVSTQWQTDSYERIDPLDPQLCRTAGGCMYEGRLVPDQRDFAKPAFAGDNYFHTATLNLTSQLTQRNKVSAFYQFGKRHKVSDSGVFRTPEATDYLTSDPDYIGQVKWVSPVTSRLLLEGGAMFYNETWRFLQQPEFPVPFGVIAKRELSTGTNYAADETNWDAYNHQYNMRFSLNYVTGTHSFKVGMADMWGTRNYTASGTQAQLWDFNQGVPARINQYARPLEDLQKLRAALGIYAQDRWTIDNLTLNLGIRYDFHEAYVPAQTTADLLFVPPTVYDEVPATPAWKDISPRFGAAWDLFGTGQTVLRANVGRYVASESVATATANNPVNTRINNANRTWNDANRNFLPDCDLANRGANGECGAMSAQLGDPSIVTTWNPAIVRGYGVRPNDTEILVGLQQGLTPRVSLDIQWTRHWYGNFFVTQNRATPPSGFDGYCVRAPNDSRLPGGGGDEICGFMDIQPEYFGQVENYVTSADDFGDVTDVYSGLDVSLQGRLANGGVFNGGVSLGSERTDFCGIIGHANIGSNAATSAGRVGETRVASFPSTNYCSVSPPFQPDFKALVTHPLPWDLNVSAVWQNRAGPEVLASYFVGDAGVSGLDRALTGGGRSVHLIAPGTEYGERVNQLDVRFSKNLNVGGGRVQVNAAVYNLFNTDATLSWNTTFGPSWLAPTRIMQGRMFKVGTQIDF
jgi:hypothetical protein